METGPEAMRRYRKMRGNMTQEHLAQLAEVSVATIQGTEQGKTRPRYDNARKFDEALEAEGEVLAAFGFAIPGSRADELSQLRVVVGLQAQVTLLLAREARGRSDDIVELDAKIAALEAALGQQQLP